MVIGRRVALFLVLAAIVVSGAHPSGWSPEKRTDLTPDLPRDEERIAKHEKAAASEPLTMNHARRAGSHGAGHGGAVISWGHDAHGAMMLGVATTVLIGVVASTVARRRTTASSLYFKHESNGGLFVVHRTSMLLAMLFAIIGVVLGILGTPEHFSSFHAIFGIVTVLIILCQVVLGGMFLGESMDRRTIHQYTGRFVMVAIGVQTMTGLNLQGWPIAIGTVLSAFLALVMLVPLLPLSVGSQYLGSADEISGTSGTESEVTVGVHVDEGH